MGVTDPAETYFQDGLWAWSVSAGAWVQLQADASGYLKATGLTLPPGAATAANQVLLQTAIDTLVDVRHALHTVGIDELDVDVQASVLPTGAATAAHQVTQNTALQLIDDLRNALHTVGTDDLDVHLTGQTADVEIVQQTPTDLTAALHGYIGAAWQKLPMTWGYSGRVEERIVELDATAGTNTLTCTAVPSGEIWVLQAASTVNKNSACGPCKIFLKSTTTFPVLAMVATLAADIALPWDGAIVLAEGDTVKGEFQGCTLNDDLHLNVWGYKMDIDL